MRTYRELSVKHHPDKSQESSRFQRLRHAYEILDDPVKLLLKLGRDRFVANHPLF